MLVNLSVTFLGILIFLFIFWKRLKEDYSAEIIFTSAFCILAGIFAGSFVAGRLYPAAFLWADFLFGLATLFGTVYFLKIRFYESFEAFIISGLPWVAFIFLKDSVINSSLSSFLAFATSLFMTFAAYWFDVHYKDFAWYKSGKIGFAGLACLGLIFLIRAVLAVSGFSVLSFIVNYEAVVSGAGAFISFLALFNLGKLE